MRAWLALLLSGCSLVLDFDDSLDGAGSQPDGGRDARVDANQQHEPNETFNASVELGAGTFPGLAIEPAGDRDFFRFQTSGEGLTHVEITFTHALGDLDLRVFDGVGAMLFVSDGVGDSELFEAMLAAGVYAIAIHGAFGLEENSYALTLVPGLTP
jgi:hypothetical protein